MALTYNAGSGDGSMTVGRLIRGIHYPLEVVYQPGITYTSYDIITTILNTSFVLIDGVNPRFFYGATGNSSPTRLYENRGLPPDEEKKFDGFVDFHKYGQPIGEAFRTLSSTPNVPTRDNQVGHISLSGGVKRIAQKLYSYDLGKHVDWFGFQLPEPDQNYESSHGWPSYYLYDHNLPYNIGSHFSQYYGAYLVTMSLKDVLSRLKTIEETNSDLFHLGMTATVPLPLNPVWGYGGNGGGEAISNVKVRHNGISYTSYHWGPYVLRVLDIDLDFNYYLNDPGNFSDQYGRDIIKNALTFRYKTRSFVRPLFGLPGNSEFHGWDILEPDTYTFSGEKVTELPEEALGGRCFPYSVPIDVGSYIPNLVDEGKSTYVSSTYDFFARNLSLFRPSVMYSFSDALGHYRALATNYLEVIYEAEELFHLAPDLIGLLHAFMDFEGGRASSGFFLDGRVIEGALRIADFFSGTYLLAKFGWSPVVSNATEISSKISKIGTALRKLQSPATLNGKFTYNLGDVYGFKDLRLTTRTKVRLGGASNDFVIATLKLDALGLLPRSSNIWDLIPWSWFVDYFVNLSGRLDVLDSMFIGLMLDVQNLTHSFTINGPIPKDLLLSQKIEPSSSSTSPEFTVYFREVSKRVPMLLASTIDFGSPKYPPDKGILLSILYQLGHQVISDG